MDLQDYKIKNSTKCDCGYEFTIRDLTELKRVNDSKFYGGNIKHVSETHCPECLKKTLLLLKQIGQTYKVIDIAQKDGPIIEAKTIQIDENGVEQTQESETTNANVSKQTQIVSNETNTANNEIICPNCKKVFKTKQGLAIHAKTCKK